MDRWSADPYQTLKKEENRFYYHPNFDFIFIYIFIYILYLYLEKTDEKILEKKRKIQNF